MSINAIQTGGLAISAPSNDFSPLSAQATATSSQTSLQDGIDRPRGLNLDDLFVSKGGGKQSTTITCPAGQEPVAVRDGQSMTVSCEKKPRQKEEATNSPSGSPILP